jgi:putative FmdB family regulatory protein
MPIYEYQCGTCGHRLEALQNLNDAPLTDCPECGRPALTKLISAAGFQLKGSGWYRSEYRARDKEPSSGSEESQPTCGQGACPACATD